MSPRPVDEWIGKTAMTTIPPRVKLRVVTAQNEICGCGCGVQLGRSGEGVEFDHEIALTNGGENREGNIQALRTPCHKLKTKKDVAEKSTVARKKAKRFGFKKPKAVIPGSKDSPWKAKINGPTERRS